MRAGPLSNKKVIDLVNGYFVPVYVVNEDYSRRGPAPAEEKAERDRIFKEGHAAGLSVGTVHVYVLRPDGRILDSMHVAKAAITSNMTAMLNKVIDTLGTKQGPPTVLPCAQAAMPILASGSLPLHLVARSLDGKGSWSEFPVENWIELTPGDQRKFFDESSGKTGETWTIDGSVAEKILTHFYPATENNDSSKNRFIERRLVATAVDKDAERTRVRLDGTLKMQHSFYHKDDGKMVEASLTGFADLNFARQTVLSLGMVTEKAAYGGGQFAVAVRSPR